MGGYKIIDEELMAIVSTLDGVNDETDSMGSVMHIWHVVFWMAEHLPLLTSLSLQHTENAINDVAVMVPRHFNLFNPLFNYLQSTFLELTSQLLKMLSLMTLKTDARLF